MDAPSRKSKYGFLLLKQINIGLGYRIIDLEAHAVTGPQRGPNTIVRRRICGAVPKRRIISQNFADWCR